MFSFIRCPGDDVSSSNRTVTDTDPHSLRTCAHLCRGGDQGSDPRGPWPPIPAHHIQLVQELIDPGMVVVTLRSHEVQGSAVLSADLLHEVIRDFLCLAGVGRQKRSKW